MMRHLSWHVGDAAAHSTPQAHSRYAEAATPASVYVGSNSIQPELFTRVGEVSFAIVRAIQVGGAFGGSHSCLVVEQPSRVVWLGLVAVTRRPAQLLMPTQVCGYVDTRCGGCGGAPKVLGLVLGLVSVVHVASLPLVCVCVCVACAQRTPSRFGRVASSSSASSYHTLNETAPALRSSVLLAVQRCCALASSLASMPSSRPFSWVPRLATLQRTTVPHVPRNMHREVFAHTSGGSFLLLSCATRRYYNNVELLKGLADSGADVMAVDIAGRTPLHIAAMCLRKAACSCLLELAVPTPIGSDAPVDLLGMTPAACAGNKWSGALVNFMVLKGFAPSKDPAFRKLSVWARVFVALCEWSQAWLRPCGAGRDARMCVVWFFGTCMCVFMCACVCTSVCMWVCACLCTPIWVAHP